MANMSVMVTKLHGQALLALAISSALGCQPLRPSGHEGSRRQPVPRLDDSPSGEPSDGPSDGPSLSAPEDEAGPTSPGTIPVEHPDHPDEPHQPDQPHQPRAPLEPTLASVTENLVIPRCVRCHSSPDSSNRYVDLSDLSRVMADTPDATTTTGEARLVIVKGCPEQSMFWLSMKDRSMPPAPLEALSSDDIEVVKAWILSLAPERSSASCSNEPPDDDDPM